MPMKPRSRKVAMLRAGVTQAMIARELGVTYAAVCLVISGNSRSGRIERAIAAAIGKSREAVFPPTVREQAVAA